MKRKLLLILSLVLISVMTFSLCACDKEPQTGEPETSVNTSDGEEQTKEPSTVEYAEPVYDGRKVSLELSLETDYKFSESTILSFNNGYCVFSLYPEQAEELGLYEPGVGWYWCAIDYEGNMVFDEPLSAGYISAFDENGLAVVRDYMSETNRYVEINTSGEVTKEITEEEYKERESPDRSNILYSTDYGWEYVSTYDESGKPFEYSNFLIFDKDGNELFGGEMIDGLSEFVDGIAVFEQDGKIGLASDTGEIVFPASFEGCFYPNLPIFVSEDRVVTSQTRDDKGYIVVYKIVTE